LYGRVDSVPCIVHGKEVFTGIVGKQVMPTQHQHTVCEYHIADDKTVKAAIDSALSPEAREWSR
jgi:1-pyrroline-5-carboxylate dehydrogenase